MLKTTAAKFFNAGLNVLPVRKDKRPACKGWKQIQDSRQSKACFQEYFSNGVFGVAVVTGFDGRELIDIDTKHDITGSLLADLQHLVEEHAPGLWERLTEVKTTSGGRHLIYRCKKIEGNQKLASRPPTDTEVKANPNVGNSVLIETRGIGGYAVGPPTPGYELLRGDYTKPALITAEERNVLLNCARFLDQIPDEVPMPVKPTTSKANGEWKGTSVWDDYNSKHTCIELLSRHGWRELRAFGSKTNVQRPHVPGEKTAPVSGHIKNDEDVFFCWSTSTCFEQRRPYRPFDIYCLLEHRGNAKEAAKALYSAGYGARQRDDDRTKYVKSVAAQQRQKIGKNGGYKNKAAAIDATIKLLDHKGIAGKDVAGIVDEVVNASEEASAKEQIAVGLYEQDGRYQRYKSNPDGSSSAVPITNFIMQGLYLVKGARPARIIHFKAVHGESETIAVPIDQLTADGLRKAAKGIGNLSAKWSSNQLEDILCYACKGQKKAETAEYLGHYEDGKVFIFANGVICYKNNKFYPVNEHGIAEPPSGCYYIPQYKNEGEPMTYREGSLNFRQFFDLMSAAYGENGRTGAAVVLAYAFSDILFRETGNIFLLFLAGKRETGKTSFADCIRAPFYFKKPAVLNMKSSSTVKSRYRMLARYSNGVVVFDEFQDIPKNTNVVVTAYNRDGYSRAATTNDNEVLETPVRANSVFIGNYLPESEPAAMSRLIILPFRKEDKNRSSLEAYRELTGQLRRGTGGMLREILALRGAMEKEYSREFSGLMSSDSLTRHVADIRDAEKVAAIMATLRICGFKLGLELEEMEEIEGFLMQQLKDQKALVDSTDHTSQFFTEVSLLIDEGTLVHGKHYGLSSDLTEVAFKLGACYKDAQVLAVKQRRTLVGKAMLKRLLMELEGFIPGAENSGYRSRRGGVLGLAFRVESLPDDVRESLIGDLTEEEEEKEEAQADEPAPF